MRAANTLPSFGSSAMDYDPDSVREFLLDKKSTLEVVEEFLIDAFERSPHWTSLDPKVREKIRLASELNIKNAVDKVFRYSESKIETIFLNSMLFFSFLRGPLFLLFTPRFSSVSQSLENMRTTDSENLYLQRLFDEQTGSKNPMEFIEALESTPNVPEQEKKRRASLHFMWRMLGFKDKFHISMQSGIEEITVEGHHIRPDILIWMPSRPEFKLIVECDGYAFHSDKSSFTRDRVRDRQLKSHDYEVLRFSGLEIYHNPVETAMELVAYLDKRFKRLFPEESDINLTSS